MKNIIFATGNKDKMREIREIMADCAAPVHDPQKCGFIREISQKGGAKLLLLLLCFRILRFHFLQELFVLLGG